MKHVSFPHTFTAHWNIKQHTTYFYTEATHDIFLYETCLVSAHCYQFPHTETCLVSAHFYNRQRPFKSHRDTAHFFAATHCNTLEHIATHCNTRPFKSHPATYYNTPSFLTLRASGATIRFPHCVLQCVAVLRCVTPHYNPPLISHT